MESFIRQARLANRGVSSFDGKIKGRKGTGVRIPLTLLHVHFARCFSEDNRTAVRPLEVEPHLHAGRAILLIFLLAVLNEVAAPFLVTAVVGPVR